MYLILGKLKLRNPPLSFLVSTLMLIMCFSNSSLVLAVEPTSPMGVVSRTPWIDARAFGVKGDGRSDDTAALQQALEYIGRHDGGTVYLPAGNYILSASVNIAKKTRLLGDGRLTTMLSFVHAGDGIRSTSPINRSTGVWIRIEDIGIISTKKGNTGGGFVDVGGSFVDLTNVYFAGWKYNIIFDQTEIATVNKCEFTGEANSVASIWIVNGSDHTLDANKGFTNNIKIQNSQFNSHPSASFQILDDGGGSHTIQGNNFNGGDKALRASGVFGLVFSGNESEMHSTYSIELTDVTYAGKYVGPVSGLNIVGNTITDIADYQIAISPATAGQIAGNFTGQARKGFIYFSNKGFPGQNQIKVESNSKLLSGRYKTAAPFTAGSVDHHATNAGDQFASTYVPKGLSTGINVCIPASMEGIYLGARLLAVNSDGSNLEQVFVTNTTEISFTAQFSSSKQIGFLLYGMTNEIEGKWTPFLRGTESPGSGKYAAQWGIYIRKGNMVHVKGNMQFMPKDGTMSGNLVIGGLPFVSDNIDQNNFSAVTISEWSGFNLPVGYTHLSGKIPPNSNEMVFIKNGPKKPSMKVLSSELDGAVNVLFDATYYIY